MNIKFICPHCEFQIELPEATVSMTDRCPACEANVVIQPKTLAEIEKPNKGSATAKSSAPASCFMVFVIGTLIITLAFVLFVNSIKEINPIQILFEQFKR